MKNNYNTLEFPGAMLKPGFSVYLFVISAKKKKYYYVGMTGDNHYPSARSAIHRLSGHFEKKNNSTQNQIWKALEERGKHENDISSVEMFHWGIDGFVKWEEKLYKFSEKKLSKENATRYRNYLKLRDPVFILEQYLISILMEEKNNVLNRSYNKLEFEGLQKNQIVKEFKKILKHLK